MSLECKKHNININTCKCMKHNILDYYFYMVKMFEFLWLDFFVIDGGPLKALVSLHWAYSHIIRNIFFFNIICFYVVNMSFFSMYNSIPWMWKVKLQKWEDICTFMNIFIIRLARYFLNSKLIKFKLRKFSFCLYFYLIVIL